MTTTLSVPRQLAETPDLVRALLSGLTEDQARAKPSPGQASIAEILELMSHSEGHGFRLLLDGMISEENPPLPGYDASALASAGQYSDHDPEDSLAHWEEQREDNLAWLESLPAEAAARTGRHAGLGPVSVAELLNERAFSDLGHVCQLIQILRMLRYYPDMGPLRALHPSRE